MKAVILAGGTGTRLWPISRVKSPKQFQSLTQGERTLFQEAIDRLHFLKPEDIYVATNIDFVSTVKAQAPEIPEENILIEPALRDTASCIGFAAAIIAKKHPDEVMAVIYADHLIQDQKEFEKKLKVAAQVAQEQNTLNIIEVKAKFPNVNLGYVKIGKMLEEVDDVEIYEFKKFVEKPDLKTAQRFLHSYKYLWNTGIYVWKIDTILKAYETHVPETYKKLLKMQSAFQTESQDKVIRGEYPTLEKISIDYAIMEKVDASQVRIIPADLGWSDIGTWISLHEELAEHPEDNLIKGDVIEMNTEGSIIYNFEGKKLVVALDMKDVAIINTPDSILICDKNRSQDVKKIVQELKDKGRNDLV